jgi:hypothetical protein
MSQIKILNEILKEFNTIKKEYLQITYYYVYVTFFSNGNFYIGSRECIKIKIIMKVKKLF